MGWGEPLAGHQSVPITVVRAAKRLADAVRTWDRQRSIGNEELMLLALHDYEQIVEQPW